MKKEIIIIIIFLSLFLISGCIIQKTGPSSPLGCPEKEYLEAVEKEDLEICKDIKPDINNPYYDNYCESQCIWKIATLKGDPNMCELINVKNISEVERWENPKKTGSIKDYCYKSLAIKLNDSSLCEKIQASPQYVICLANLGEKDKLPAGLPGS